jgi:polyphosphate kinase
MSCARAAHETGDDRGIVPEHPAIEKTLLLDATRGSTSTGNREAHTAGDTETDGQADGADSTELPPVMDAHADRWYVPDSQRYSYAVRTPDGDRSYRKTADAAAALVERYWAGDEEN